MKYHSFFVAHAGVSTHIHTRAGIHTHVRGRACAPHTHTHTQNNRCVNGDARLTKRVYMSMYARVHIQSTSRMCFIGFSYLCLLLHFFFFCRFVFYFTQLFVTARIIGRKCNRDDQASVITAINYTR